MSSPHGTQTVHAHVSSQNLTESKGLSVPCGRTHFSVGESEALHHPTHCVASSLSLRVIQWLPEPASELYLNLKLMLSTSPPAFVT